MTPEQYFGLKADPAAQPLIEEYHALQGRHARAVNEITQLRTELAAAQATVERMRSVLTAQLEWFEAEYGPLYHLWEECRIGNWDNETWDWPRSLEAVQDEERFPTAESLMTDVIDIEPDITRYRNLRRALSASAPSPVQAARDRFLDAAMKRQEMISSYSANPSTYAAFREADKQLALAYDALRALVPSDAGEGG